MTEFTIRDAQAGDLPTITEIYRHAVIHGTASYELDPPDEAEMSRRYSSMLKEGYPYIVAETADGEVAGYAYANAFRARPAYRWAVEDSVYLAEKFQGKGLGKLLLAELLKRSETLGFRQMVAVIGGAEHKASIGLHERLGFEMIGIFKGSGWKHGRWLDTVLMQKQLGDGNATAPDPDTYPGTLHKPKSA